MQGTLPLLGAAQGDQRLMAFGAQRQPRSPRPFVILVRVCPTTQAYVTSDFSVANVVANSHWQPLLY